MVNISHLPVAALAVLALSSVGSGARAEARYSVREVNVQGHATYHLQDHELKMDFGLVPDVGNFAYEFKVNGKDVLLPVESFQKYIQARGFQGGIPFLEPFANRISHDYYFFQGRKYLLNTSIGNFLTDQFHQPIHGLLVYERRWKVVSTHASDAEGASVTSRLDFYKYPDLMAQFPFAHTVEVTYRLKGGKLENTTTIENVGASEMPIAFGYHPYFRPSGLREDWAISLPATKYWLLDKNVIPTGATEPASKVVPDPLHFRLGDRHFDGIFSGLERDADGRAALSVSSQGEKIQVVYGKRYPIAVVYAPRPQDLICFEPYTAPTDAFNLNHEGKLPDLPVLKPGQTFRAHFWIVPTGF